MMQTVKLSALALVLSSAATYPAGARDLVVGLSPNQAPAALKAQAEQVVQHMMRTVAPGEKALVFDAYNNRLIGTFAVPSKAAYQNPRAKLAANREVMGALKAFIDAGAPVPGRINTLDLPGFFRLIAGNYPAPEGADLIVLGSPLADDPLAPSASMRGGAVPGDGHIAARASQSPYGMADLSGSLEGYDVYFGVTGESWEISVPHANAVERFWTLETETGGGSMQFFGEDLQTLFARAGADAAPRSHANALVPTTKLEMIQFEPDTGAIPDIYTQPLAVAPAPAPLWSAAGDVRIGISWDCGSWALLQNSGCEGFTSRIRAVRRGG